MEHEDPYNTDKHTRLLLSQVKLLHDPILYLKVHLNITRILSPMPRY